MTTFLTIVGAICALGLCLAVVIATVHLAGEAREKRRARARADAYDLGRHSVGLWMEQARHWFGEWPECAILMRLLAHRLTTCVGLDESRLREELRAELRTLAGVEAARKIPGRDKVTLKVDVDTKGAQRKLRGLEKSAKRVLRTAGRATRTRQRDRA